MKAIRVIGMGVAGIVVAAILSLGAFAVAGGSIGEPARPVSVPSGHETTHSPSKAASPATSPEPSDDHGAASESPFTPTTSSSADSHVENPSSNDHDGDD